MADEMRTSYVGQCKVCGQLVVFEHDREPEDVWPDLMHHELDDEWYYKKERVGGNRPFLANPTLNWTFSKASAKARCPLLS